MSERIGTGEPYTQSQPRIADRCPCCGGQTLFIGAGGWLTCSVIGCKAPGAASDLLAQAPALAAHRARYAPAPESLADVAREAAEALRGNAALSARLLAAVGREKGVA